VVGQKKEEGVVVKKIKVMRIITRLNVGGPAIHALLLTRWLDPDVFENILVVGGVGKNEGDMGYLADELGVKPVVVPTLGREIGIADDIVSFLRILSLIRRERPDIIHTHLAKAGALGRVAGALVKFVLIFSREKTKIFHTYHGHIFHGYFGPAKTRVFICIERVLSLVCEKVIVISALQREDIVERYRVVGDKKAVVIPLGFDFSPVLRPRDGGRIFRKDAGCVGDERLVGIIGRLTAIKNHRLFLAAAAAYLSDESMAPARFAVVGDGELRDELEARARELGIADRVSFMGWRRDMGEVYAGLDAVVLTSDNEGTPVTVIEAMAVGKPVVTTAVGGVPDLLGRGAGPLPRICERGIMVAPSDDKGVAWGLGRLFADDRTTERIVRDARAFAHETFGKDRLVRDIGSLYLSALGME
jgi:glycosyltransferase involved in cell wall biosynthesis